MDLSGYVLHDDRGSGDDEAFVFPAIFNSSSSNSKRAGLILGPGEFVVLCANSTVRHQKHC